ncbi:fatty acyl-AMP ligase [Burkholderia cepacia]|uniref:AMP-binding protein n=1 Tax=Burkholderia cepacia TaxID=292 RepID=UPI0007531382|nr:AMP-binding protein [Burkholderia cepacia]KVQ49915.1 fatty acyl-AMP ligase [Burkholderia cepacia]
MESDHEIRQAVRPDVDAARLLTLIDALSTELYGARDTPGRASLDARFDSDLGFDSLTRAELFDRIEQAFGVRLPVDVFASATTPRDLLDALNSNRTPAACRTDHPSAAPAAPEWPVPADCRTLVDALYWHVEQHPDRTHIVLLADGERETTISYARLYRDASALAGGLSAKGIGPYDTVALMLPTGPDYFSAFIAILLCGAVPVPIYPPLRPDQLAEHVARHTAIFANAQVKALVSFNEAAPAARLLKARVATLQHVLVPGQLASATLPVPVPAAKAGDLVLLQYTSGSTGEPKGVELTHANLLANIRAMGKRMDVRSTDVVVSWLPLYHDMGLIGAWLAPMFFGVPVVVMPPLVFLARPELWLRALARYRGTISAAPNFAYERCARHLALDSLADLDLSAWRLACCGAEPVNPHTMRAFAAHFAPLGFDAHALTPVYGLAENTLGVTFPPPGRGMLVDRVSRTVLAETGRADLTSDDDDALEVPSCGQPLAGTAMRIVDEGGRALPERSTGRIEFRGDSATRGYFRNPANTTGMFDGTWIDSGDLGYLSEGELYVTGRVKDLIIRGGRHYFPYELEAAIARLPDVVPAGVAVCGASDTTSGTERLVILVESFAANEAAAARLRSRVNDATTALWGAPAEEVGILAPHTILKTPSGKIRHEATLNQYLQRGGRAARTPAVATQLVELAMCSVVPVARRTLWRAAGIAWGVYCWMLVALFAPAVCASVAWRGDWESNWRRAALACRLFLRLAGIHTTLRGVPDALGEGVGIVVANHASYIDVVVLFAQLPRPVRFVAKRELASTPFIGRMLRALGTCFVERRDYRRSLEDEAVLVAHASGDTLLFFPEGTFTRTAGLAPFRLGAFRAACVNGRPVVPVALKGTRAVLCDGEWLPHRHMVDVTIGGPLQPDGVDFRAMACLRDRARDVILASCGEADLGNAGRRWTTFPSSGSDGR